METQILQQVTILYSHKINSYKFYILIKFTKTNNYNTKAKGAWKYITTLRLTLNMETQILQQVTILYSHKINSYKFYILIKFTKTNNYNTKAKGAWKYITTLRLTLNMETQILQQVTILYSHKINSYKFYILIKFTKTNNYNTKAKGAWKYITTLRLTLNMETQILQQVTILYSHKINSYKFYILIKFTKTNNYNAKAKGAWKYITTLRLTLNMETQILQQVTILYSHKINSYKFYILIKFTKTNNYNTKAKGAWKYITTLRLTLNMETQILQQVTILYSHKINSYKFYILIKFTKTNNYNTKAKGAWKYITTLRLTLNMETQILQQVTILYSHKINSYKFYILIKFTKTNNYNTKAKGAWKYITTLRLTLNMETQILQQVTILYSHKINSYKFYILIKFTKTNNYNTKAKGAWKYITTLRLTLNMETQILQQVTISYSHKINSYKFYILIKFTKTNNYNTKAKGAWKYITTLRLTLNMETQILQQVTILYSHKINSYKFYILIKFTKTNNYNTKAKGAWKYITTLRLTLNMETQILQQVTILYSHKINSYKFYILIKFTTTNNYNTRAKGA